MSNKIYFLSKTILFYNVNVYKSTNFFSFSYNLDKVNRDEQIMNEENQEMITIEKAVVEDAQEITRIKTRAFNKEINTYLGRNGGPPGYDCVESEIAIIEKHVAYKILLNQQIIGAFFLIILDDHKVRFEDFVIDPLYQGKGYGFKTLQMIEEEYAHVTEWYLSTPIFSIGNQHLYEKFGYREISRDDHEIEYLKCQKKN